MFSRMISNIGPKKAIIYALLAAHTLWIANHMRLVYMDRVNPWRLGGYGMYTTADPRTTVRVIDTRFPGAPMFIPPTEASFTRMQAAVRFTNITRAFRCAHITDDLLKVFFQENKNLVGRNMTIQFLDRYMLHKAPWLERRLQGQVAIEWQGDNQLTYHSQFCGDELKGVAILP